MENTDDLKKYFDEKQYITAIVGIDGIFDVPTVKSDKVSNLIALITDPENKELKEEALLTLKKEKGGYLLLAAIEKTKDDAKKQQLIAACWESEIDFTEHLPFFISLVMSDNYFVFLEALTVIENMEGSFVKKDLVESISKLKNHKKNISSEQLVLINDLEYNLNEKLSAL